MFDLWFRTFVYLEGRCLSMTISTKSDHPSDLTRIICATEGGGGDPPPPIAYLVEDPNPGAVSEEGSTEESITTTGYSMSTSMTTTGGDETPPENLLSENNKSSGSEQLLETTSSTSTTMSVDTDDTSTTMNTRGSRDSSPNLELDNPSDRSSPIDVPLLQTSNPENFEDENLTSSMSEVVTFPIAELARLDDMISNPRWVVPVLPGGQLEVLLDATIELAKRDLDTKVEPCQKFMRDGLTISFNKILTDDAVSSWKPEIHKCILKNSERLVDLLVIKLDQDNIPLLDLMGILYNPANKFHTYNSGRQPESYASDVPLSDDELFARPVEMRLTLNKGSIFFRCVAY
jgi:hypothetical protein